MLEDSVRIPEDCQVTERSSGGLTHPGARIGEQSGAQEGDALGAAGGIRLEAVAQHAQQPSAAHGLRPDMRHITVNHLETPAITWKHMCKLGITVIFYCTRCSCYH